MSAAQKAAVYADIYLLALTIPAISVIGVLSGSFFLRLRARRMRPLALVPLLFHGRVVGGLGLAAPFVLVTLVPGWARIVPRSGPWTLHVRAALGFLLLATAVWLLWILGRVTSLDGVIAVLAGLWLLAICAWLYGRLQQAGRSGAGRWVALAALGLLLVSTNTVSLDPAPPAPPTASSHGESVYAAARVQAALREGRPAFVYFTADWCITCKANERLVLKTDAVRKAFAERRVAVFRADWTRRDESIRAELARFGKAGVPLTSSIPRWVPSPSCSPRC